MMEKNDSSDKGETVQLASKQERLLTVDQKFISKTSTILAAVIPANPSYKDIAGQVIYEFVVQLVGEEKAPKVTGMLVALPVDDLVKVLKDYTLFKTRVNESNEALEKSSSEL